MGLARQISNSTPLTPNPPCDGRSQRRRGNGSVMRAAIADNHGKGLGNAQVEDVWAEPIRDRAALCRLFGRCCLTLDMAKGGINRDQAGFRENPLWQRHLSEYARESGRKPLTLVMAKTNGAPARLLEIARSLETSLRTVRYERHEAWYCGLKGVQGRTFDSSSRPLNTVRQANFSWAFYPSSEASETTAVRTGV